MMNVQNGASIQEKERVAEEDYSKWNSQNESKDQRLSQLDDGIHRQREQLNQWELQLQERESCVEKRASQLDICEEKIKEKELRLRKHYIEQLNESLPYGEAERTIQEDKLKREERSQVVECEDVVDLKTKNKKLESLITQGKGMLAERTHALATETARCEVRPEP